MLLFRSGVHRARGGLAWVGVFLLSFLFASASSAMTIEYSIGSGPPTSAWSDGFCNLVSDDLGGLLTLDTGSDPVAAGTSVSVLGLDLAGTGRLCETCDEFALSIGLDPQGFTSLQVQDTSFKEGNRLTLQGVIGLAFLLDFGGGNVVSGIAQAFTSLYYGGISEASIFTVLDIDPTSWQFSQGAIEPGDISILKLAGPGTIVEPVPEPSTLAILAAGLAGLMGFRRRTR